ncbi:MAG: RNA methyltransferase [Candidatus Hydrogenedentes bacterium]|nr:RNA methyltransferase [Candidatus Hydrogenedentota bacterium]
MSELEPHYANIPPEHVKQLARNPVHIVLDNLRSAFNVGSIFRTSDAGAAAHIHLCGLTAYPPHVKLEKTALGALDYVPWTYHDHVSQALDQLRAEHIPIVAVEVAEGAVSHVAYSWPLPVAIVFGNEVTGIQPETLAQCGAVVQIPMHGYKNTINVATAFGVVLYEILRQWGALNEE